MSKVDKKLKNLIFNEFLDTNFNIYNTNLTYIIILIYKIQVGNLNKVNKF